MRLRSELVALPVLLFAAASLAAQGASPPAHPVRWVPAPALFPRGVQIAVLSGDPFKPTSQGRAVGRLSLRLLTLSFAP
jgi:hypothetical protein